MQCFLSGFKKWNIVAFSWWLVLAVLGGMACAQPPVPNSFTKRQPKLFPDY